MVTDEQAAIDRRRRIAEMMMAQGAEPLETNQVAGGYVVPVSPMAGVAKVAQQLAGAYINRKADDEQRDYNSSRKQAIIEAMSGNNGVNYEKLSGAVDADTMANILMQRQTRKEALADKLEQKRQELEMPTNDMRNATWATGGDENAARELVANKMQNPLAFLQYQLNASNAAANQDIQRQNLDIRKQEVDASMRRAEEAAIRQQQAFERQQQMEAEKAQAAKQPKPIYDAGSNEWVYPPSEQNPNGERTVSQDRIRAVESLNYLSDKFLGTKDNPGPIYTTPTGGAMGYKGKLARITDTQKVKDFENMREMLSTQLRTIFRIPGEGTLSDREQAQYGLQLPSVENDQAINERIINDIKTVSGMRIGIKSENNNEKQKPIQPGYIDNGYMFKGGDPNDENNWVKQ